MSNCRRPLRALAVPIAMLLSLEGTVNARAASGQDQPEHSLRARLAAVSLLLDGSAAGDLVVAVGERGHILLSRDAGVSWRQAEVESRALLTGVWMIDEKHGCAVGHDETILLTSDGGETWRRVRFAPEEERPLLDVWFADSETGIAVGAYGAFFVTSDGGETWSEQPISEYDDFHLNQIVPAGDARLYLAAEAGSLYRSDDGGATWMPLTSPYEGSFFGGVALDRDVLLVFGLRGNLFRTDDGGDTWSAIETGTVASLTAGLDLGGGRVVIAGLEGVVLRSEDGGRSFRLDESPDRRAATALVTVPDDVLILGEGGAHRLSAAD